MLKAFGWMFAALAVFLPRRNVTMTVERIDRAALPGIAREKLNPYLEEWYNRGAPRKAESLYTVAVSCWICRDYVLVESTSSTREGLRTGYCVRPGR